MGHPVGVDFYTAIHGVGVCMGASYMVQACGSLLISGGGVGGQGSEERIAATV